MQGHQTSKMNNITITLNSPSWNYSIVIVVKKKKWVMLSSNNTSYTLHIIVVILFESDSLNSNKSAINPARADIYSEKRIYW